MGSDVADALIEFAEQNQIPIAKDKRGDAPFSVDANLLHVVVGRQGAGRSRRGSARLRLSRTIDPEKAPDKPTVITDRLREG